MRSQQAFFHRVASSLIVPITFLPVAAILLAIGTQLHIGPVEAAGLAVIQRWLPLFFAIGIAVGFADSDAMAALTVVAGFVVMNGVAQAVAGDSALNVGVLGGIIVGAVCTWLFNRVKNATMPEFLALFSGKRLGPWVGAGAGLVLGYVFGLCWPPVYGAIETLGRWLHASGGAGAFVYGSSLRILIPTGLHHILMQLIDNQIGAWTSPEGQTYVGEYIRFLAGDPGAGRILSGFFLTLGFGPLGAAMAIVREARPEQRRKVAGLMTTGALTAMILGVTEPVEFAFIFASPLLYVVHILFSGLAQLITYALDIHLGGYALPMILFNWGRQHNGWMLLPVGVAYTVLYYYTFRLVIRWRRPPILGQVPEAKEEAAPLPATEEGAAFVEAVGGWSNVLNLDACMTRLRLEVKDPALVDVARLRSLGAAGILRSGGSDVQVVVGVRAGEVAGRMREASRGGTPAAVEPQVVAHPFRKAAGEVVLLSPLTGRVAPLETVPDPVFAQGLAGVGAAVEASEGTLLAPVSGRVLHVFPGGHAIGIVTEEGLEVLVHVGLDTVALHGDGFSVLVADGDALLAGDALGRFDPELVAARGKSLLSPVLVTNPDRLDGWNLMAEGAVRAGEPLLRLRVKPLG